MRALLRAYCRLFHRDHRHPCRASWECRFARAARNRADMQPAIEPCGNIGLHEPHQFGLQFGDPESAERRCESRWCTGVSAKETDT